MTDRQKDLKDMYDGTKKNTSRFQYVDITKLERLGITQYKPVLGENAIRIVFPPDRPGKFVKKISIHSNIGADKNTSTFLCLKEMFNQPCPVDELAEELRKRNPADEKIKELRTSIRYLAFVFDVLNEGTEQKGLRWFDCPKSIFKDIMAQSKQRKRSPEEIEKYIDITNPTCGRDVEFEQTKNGDRIEYIGVKLVDNNPIPEEWYKGIPEFDEVLHIPTYDEVKTAVGEQFSSTDAESEVVDDVTTEVEATSTVKTTEKEEAVARGNKPEGVPTRNLPTRRVTRKVETETDDAGLAERVRIRTEEAKVQRQSRQVE